MRYVVTIGDDKDTDFRVNNLFNGWVDGADLRLTDMMLMQIDDC